MASLKWYLEQLLPLKYKSNYKSEGKKLNTVWNMWFGKCFNIETKELKT